MNHHVRELFLPVKVPESRLSSQYIESYVKLTNAYSRYFAHFPYKRTSSATIRRSAMGPEYPPQSLPQSPRFTRAGQNSVDKARSLRQILRANGKYNPDGSED